MMLKLNIAAQKELVDGLSNPKLNLESMKHE